MSLHSTVYRSLRANILHRMIPRSMTRPVCETDSAIEVVGLFSLAVGLGESARLCAQDLKDNSDHLVLCRDVAATYRKRPEVAWSWPRGKTSAPAKYRIFHLNPPMLPPAIFAVGLRNFSTTYNIGYWAWELEQLPAEWTGALRYMNAVFVPSHFTRRAIERAADVPVVVVPHSVRIDSVERGMRASLGISAETFLVSFVFGFDSAFNRKNPLGAVEAFRRAFPAEADAVLVLKSSHGGASRHNRQALTAALAAVPNIKLIDEIWPAERVHGLLAESDAYISLHRSEGFGLTIAEAMMLRTPVVVTDWSGSTDFCRADYCYLVKAGLVAVDDPHIDFRNMGSARWAEPDLNCAASHLRTIFTDRMSAKNKAAAARQHMCEFKKDSGYGRAIANLAGDHMKRSA